MRVRANSLYIYDPNFLDQIHKCSDGTKGQLVRVINLPSAPKCNTMGQCHIEDAATKQFLGMVSTNSLTKASKEQKKALTQKQ